MTSWRPKTIHALRVLSMLSFSWVVLCESAAPARADPSVEAEQRELKRELESLKQRARALEERIRLLEARRARQAQAQSKSTKKEVRCDVPFYLDGSGVKHLRRDCAEVWTQVTCARPFALTRDGIKQFRAECATVPSASFERNSAP